MIGRRSHRHKFPEAKLRSIFRDAEQLAAAQMTKIGQAPRGCVSEVVLAQRVRDVAPSEVGNDGNQAGNEGRKA